MTLPYLLTTVCTSYFLVLLLPPPVTSAVTTAARVSRVCQANGGTCPPTLVSSASSLKMHSGHELPRVGLGVYQTKPGEETYQSCLAALELGYRHIDTAAMYGNERAVGRAVRDSGVPRDEIFITTKFWPGTTVACPLCNNLKPGSGFDLAIEKGVESNTKLGLDYIDLYLIHAPAWGSERVNVWRGFQELQKRGLVRSIGVSNYGISHLEEIIDSSDQNTIPAVNQIELHPFMLHNDIEEYCRMYGIVIEAYAPIAQATRLENALLVKIAKQHQKSAAQVMLRWGIQRGYVILPKSVRKYRIQENKDLDGFELSKQEMVEISALDEYKGTSWDPTKWD